MCKHPFIFGAGVGSGSGGGSISSVAVSDSTPNFGDTITITATPTGLTPTSYLFFAFDGTSITFIAEQAGAVANWSVSEAGTFDVYAVATDGTINAWGLTSVVVADPLLICDLIATKPVWGVWMQRLTLDYTGPAGLVRRSSDNALLSINYIGKDWDLTALTNFVGVGNGFEVTLYDQFGSNDPTQANAALQPACVIIGVVQYLGGKITLFFDGTNDQMRIPSDVTFAHGFVLAAKTSDTNLVQYPLGGTGQGVLWGGTVTNFIGLVTVGGNLISNVNSTDKKLASFRLAGGGAGRLNINGVSNVTGTTSTSMTINRIGTRPDNPSLLHIGRFTGAIAYTSGLSDADWATIDNAIVTEYGL